MTHKLKDYVVISNHKVWKGDVIRVRAGLCAGRRCVTAIRPKNPLYPVCIEHMSRRFWMHLSNVEWCEPIKFCGGKDVKS